MNFSKLDRVFILWKILRLVAEQRDLHVNSVPPAPRAGATNLLASQCPVDTDRFDRMRLILTG